jgi:putative glutamine amidotransferase
MKPVILITTKFKADDFSVGGLLYTPRNYCEAITRAGGIPLLAAMGDAADYAKLADGILFTGAGNDIQPQLYGQENRDAKDCNALLDETELALFDAFRSQGKPILGICRGIQLINVALGGTLVQDIPTEIPDLTVHARVYNKETVYHPVTAAEGSLFAKLFGRDFQTNSYHHQSIGVCGQGLVATVRTQDNVVEAVEHESLPILATQWHPERMIGQEQTELTDMMPLFRHFIELCRGTKN